MSIVIFLSHSSRDRAIANELKEQLERSLNTIKPEIFVSSAPDGIDIGEQWFNKVIDQLRVAVAMIFLVTPNSVKSNWVWFEFGFFWSKAHDAIYPLYVPQVMEIPSPLNQLQAKLLTNKAEFDVFLNKLHDQLGISRDDVGDFNFDAILSVVNEASFEDYAPIASGNDAKETLRDFLKHAYDGEWLVYRTLDQQKSLASGSSKKYLKSLVEEDGKIYLEVVDETNTGIRFKEKRPPPKVISL